MQNQKAKIHDQYRNDLLLAAVILAAALFGTFLRTGSIRDGARAVVYVNGEKSASYPLSADGEIWINGTNLLVIRDGTAKMAEAGCPDRLCVKQHAVSRNGESIVCLPNRIVVTIEADEEEGVDAQVY